MPTKPKKTPSGGGGSGLDEALSKKLGPLPVWVWISGVIGGYLVYRQRKAASGSSTTGTTDQGLNTLQNLAQAQSILNGLGTYDTTSPAVNGLQTQLSSLEQQVSMLGAGNSGTTQSGAVAPGSTSTSGQSTPPPPSGLGTTNKYAIGQTVAPGESIVADVWNPTYGWLNATSIGGVYEGSSGAPKLPGLASYQGYLQSIARTPQGAAEMAHPISFQNGTIANNAQGNGYVLTAGGGAGAGDKYAFA